jgi:hypothetical protein
MKLFHLFYDFQYLHSKVLIADMENWKSRLFGANQIEFWIIAPNNEVADRYVEISNESNFKFFTNPTEAVLSFVKQSLRTDCLLIIHGGNYNIWKPLFFLPSIFLRRIKWICWGSQINRGSRGLKSFLYFIIRKRVFANMSQINFLITSEINSFKANGFYNEKVSFNPYFYSGYDAFLKCKLTSGTYNKQLKKIIVGNSGHSVNNHFEALQMIENKSSAVKILLPVSYGHQKYISDLKSFASSKFLNRISFLDQFLPIKDLVELFYQSDALVMYSNEQSGLFAIYAFLYFGKPVFLKKEGRLDVYFRELGVHCFYLEEFNDDFNVEVKVLESNKQIILDLLNSEASFGSWSQFFRQ